MGAKCHTASGESWESTVNGAGDGSFTVDTEDLSGDFEGKHDGDPIKGNCNGTKIKYDRPKTGAKFKYDGTFMSDTHITGTRKSFRLMKGKRTLTDEEPWDATKTTFLETTSRRATTKAGGKKTTKKTASKKGATKKAAAKKTTKKAAKKK